jgi:integrase
MQAAEAAKVLEGTGVSLVEAARMAKAAVSAGNGAEKFEDRYWRALLDGEGRWSRKYLTQMEDMPRWMGKAGMEMRCGEMTRETIDRLLRANGSKAISTVTMRRTRVMAVVNYQERVRGTKGSIRILTAAQAGRVLRACVTADERRAVALLLWAGIRPDAESGELGRLEWDSVGETEVYVSAEVAKTNTDRHVPITGRLRRLLRGHPKEGPVCPAGWRRAWQRIRRVSGISEMQDVCRHTFASHLLAWKGEDATKQAMGHAKGSDVLFRHYRRAVTRENGVRYFR